MKRARRKGRSFGKKGKCVCVHVCVFVCMCVWHWEEDSKRLRFKSLTIQG